MNISLSLYVTVNTSNWGSGKNLAKHFYKTPEENKALTVVEKRLATAEPADSHMQGHTFRSIVGRKYNTCCCCNLADKASATETTTACKSQQLMRSCVAITTTTRSMHESICVMRPNHLPESIHFRAHTHTHTHIWVWTRRQIHTHTYHIWVWTRGQTHTHSRTNKSVQSQQPTATSRLWTMKAPCDMWYVAWNPYVARLMHSNELVTHSHTMQTTSIRPTAFYCAANKIYSTTTAFWLR